MRFVVSCGALLSLLAASSGALAKPPPAPERLFGPDLSVSLEPSSGMGSTSSVCDADPTADCTDTLFTVGAAALARFRFLELGTQLESSASLLGGETHTFWSGLGGLQTEGRGWARLELLAEVGAHSIEDVGTDFLVGTTRSIDATVPFLGVRVGASARLGRGAARLVLGAWLVFRADVEHQERTVQETGLCIFSPCPPVEKTYEIGGNSTLLGFRLGVEVR